VIGGIQEVNDFIPLKIKQSDFVKSIFQMYNLYVEVNTDQPNKLTFRHRDEFYDSGEEKNWTYKLMKDKEQNLLFLPDVTNKKLKLTYKADTDSANTVYTQMTDEIYGQIEYTFDNEYVKDTDTKELIFSPTPVTKTQFDAYVPMISGQSPSMNIRICYDGGQQSCNQWDLIEYGTTGFYGIQEYPAIGHFDNPLSPTFDINFGMCDYYFYQVPTLTANNLYNLYWRRTVNQINVGKMLTAYFDLNEADIQTLKLNDKIRIDNSWWNINKVIDYNANDYAPTKVELISVDSDIEFAPFKTKPGLATGGTVIAAAVDKVLKSNMTTNNVIMEGADAIVKGEGNVVMAGIKGMIIGDNNVLENDGIITPRINNQSASEETPTYKRYIATMNQTGTSAPVAHILENTIGAIVWVRASAGLYYARLSGAFPSASNTYLMMSNAVSDNQVAVTWNSTGEIMVQTVEMKHPAPTPHDNHMNNNTIEIRVYE
jgi:hypothetical protein